MTRAPVLLAAFMVTGLAPRGGDAAAPPASAGEQVFASHCAICHADGRLYPGTMQLRQNGQPQAVLARRTDLDADYIRQVARTGIGSMPPFTPLQLSDGDLEATASWLAGKK